MGGCFLVVVVWAAVWVWAGRGCSSRKAGRPTVSRGLVSRGWGWLPGAWYKRHARSGGLLRLLWLWWSAGGGCPRVLGVCGGGMLSGFWGSAPWLPDLSGAPGCGGSWVGVGGLVVNCIVDASILL